jgi:type I restriction enzyme S subunit
MDDATAALFPDRFVDSELGPIPEGWRISTIGSECEAVGGGTPSTNVQDYWDGGQVNWATPKDLSGLSEPVLVDTSRRITEEGLSRISSGLLPRGTVLLSSRAPVGYTAIAGVPLAVNQGFIAMRETQELPRYYIYFWVQTNLDEILQRAGGTTFAEISKRNFRPIALIVPPTAIVQRFSEWSSSYFKLIENNMKESQALTHLRDLLLPKLLSGEIRIADAEKVVQEVS